MSFLLVAAFLALAAALAAAVWAQFGSWEQRLKTARVTYALINAERAKVRIPLFAGCGKGPARPGRCYPMPRLVVSDSGSYCNREKFLAAPRALGNAGAYCAVMCASPRTIGQAGWGKRAAPAWSIRSVREWVDREYPGQHSVRPERLHHRHLDSSQRHAHVASILMHHHFLNDARQVFPQPRTCVQTVYRFHCADDVRKYCVEIACEVRKFCAR